MLAEAVGFRPDDPLKITSVMFSPRSCLAELSPMTQRTASITLDLPQPLGPTMALSFPGNMTEVASTKDLKPASLICFRRMQRADTGEVKKRRSLNERIAPAHGLFPAFFHGRRARQP